MKTMPICFRLADVLAVMDAMPSKSRSRRRFMAMLGRYAAYDLSVNDTNQVAGKNFPNIQTISAQDIVGIEPLIPVGQPGVLTTRTSNTAGTLTMTNTEHGITTASFIDIYFLDANTPPNVTGQCRYATVGTVSGVSVPFTLATGDDLPAATTPIVASLVQSFSLAMVGNNLAGLLAAMDNGDPTQNGVNGSGTVRLLSSGSEELFMALTPNGSYRWIDDFTNPISGDTIDTVNLSHSNIVTPVNMRVTGLLT